jgi:hypothetical protein
MVSLFCINCQQILYFSSADAGAGFDFLATERLSLFGAFEATLMSDRSRTAAAKAGLKFAL